MKGLAAVIVALGTLSILWGWTEWKKKHPAPGGSESYELTAIIDAHAHFEDNSGLVQPTPKMEDEYRKNHVIGAVVHYPRGMTSRFSIRADSSVKFVTCAGINPGMDIAFVEAGLKDGTFRCEKFYLGYVPRYANDPVYEPFIQLAEKYHVPIVFHTGDTEDRDALVKYADPLYVDEVAVRHRGIPVVMAHMGNPWLESAAEVAYKNPNVYVDTSALMIGDIEKSGRDAMDDLITRPVRWFNHYVEDPNKLMFGTDWPLVSVGPYLEALKRVIPRLQWRKVFYENAARVFGFPPMPASSAAAR